MLPTALPQEERVSLEPSSLQPPASQLPTEPVTTEHIALQSQPLGNHPVMSMNPVQFGNGPSWLSSSGQQPVYPVYPFSDQQAVRSSIVPSQMQSNASFPWMFPHYPVPFLNPAGYPPYGPFVHPSPFFPMVVSSSVSQVSSSSIYWTFRCDCY